MQYVSPAPWYEPSYNPNTVPKVPGVPVIPPLPHPQRREFAAQCGECGRMIPNGPELYSCANMRCPVQPKVWC